MSQSSQPLRVGLLGVGSIGQTIAAALDSGRIPGMALVAMSDTNRPLAEEVCRRLKCAPPLVSLDELVDRSDLIVEAAGQAALPQIVPKALAAGKNLLTLSVGGLLGHEDWFAEAERRGCRIFVPSGAIGGLDALKGAARGRLDCVTLTSRKPVAALRGTKFVVDTGLDVDLIHEDTVIFDGSPEEACRAFPTTSNVAATLRLAVGPSANIRVRVVASPRGARNIHEIQAEGEFGRLQMVTENVPSSNPRTSQLAAFSAVATLEGIVRSARIGT